jgi:hypothetical protein
MDYLEKFLSLLAHNDPLSSKQQVQLFMSGLTDLLRVDVEMQKPPDLQEAMSLARAFEHRADTMSAANTSANHGRSRSSSLSRWPGQQRNQSTPLPGGSGQAGGGAPGTGNITSRHCLCSRPFKQQI